MELASRSDPDGKFRLSAIHHFTVDGSGKIARMVVYLRSGGIEDPVSATNPNYPRTSSRPINPNLLVELFTILADIVTDLGADRASRSVH
jgi:hypothetical protein